MDPSVIRKSWFCASPTVVQLTPTKQTSENLAWTVKPVSPESPNLTCSVVVNEDENEEPIKVTASDLLTLTTFSKRAVVDFGTVSFTLGCRHVRYLLLENPHDWEQEVTIQRRPPSDEFTLDWIGPKTEDPSWSQTPIPQSDGWRVPNGSICMTAAHGRCLLRLTWHPSPQCPSSQTGMMRHVIQFRVNQGYPLQTLVVGRLLLIDATEKPGPRSRRMLPSTASLPNWTTARRSTCSLDRSVNYSDLHSTIRQASTLRPATSKINHYPSDRSRQLMDSMSLTKHLVARSVMKQPIPETPTFLPDWVNRGQQSPLATKSPRSLTCSPSRSRTMIDFDATITNTVVPNRRASRVVCRASNEPTGEEAFLSPRVVRQPAAPRDPIISQMDYNAQPPLPLLTRLQCSLASSGNLFYNTRAADTLSELSEHGLVQWLNAVFAPCMAANTEAAVMNNHGFPNQDDALLAATAQHRLVKAVELLHVPSVTGPGRRLEREVDEGKITTQTGLAFRVDRGAQQSLTDQVTSSYASVWLRLALDALGGGGGGTVSGSTQPSKSTNTTDSAIPTTSVLLTPLCRKLRVYLFTPSGVSHPSREQTGQQASTNTTATIKSREPAGRAKPVVTRDGLHNRHVIKRFLILVWFLDRLKLNKLIELNPCLFRPKSRTKSSADILLAFSSTFLTGENNLVRHLANLGVQVEVVQTALEEYSLQVSNIAVDLRDGVRLVKLAELLLSRLPESTTTTGPTLTRAGRHQRSNSIHPSGLMLLVRYPAISRLQKIHNVRLALGAFEKHGRLCMADGSAIDPRDIVDGHRDRSLTLLWCLLLRYQVRALIQVKHLREEIERLHTKQQTLGVVAGRLLSEEFQNEANDQDECEGVHEALLAWAATVCRPYGVTVSTLNGSFADGRALCFLVHHYLPTVMPRGLIRQPSELASAQMMDRLSRYNLRLFQRKLAFLGDIPVLLTATVSGATGSCVLPPGLVIATLAYLASRLVLIPQERAQLRELVEDHAARILQTAWRERQRCLAARRLRLLTTIETKTLETPPRSILPVAPNVNRALFGTPASPAMLQFFNTRNSIKVDLPPSSTTSDDDDSSIMETMAGTSTLPQPPQLSPEEAAIRLQYAIRKWLQRIRHVRSLEARTAARKEKDSAARIIQHVWRAHRARRLERIASLTGAAVCVQRRWRTQLAQRRRNQAILLIQAHCRGFLTRRRLEQRHGAATLLQAYWRGHVARRRWHNERAAATRIQSSWRRYSARREWLYKRRAVILVQAQCRGFLTRARLFQRHLAATVLQSHWRGHLIRAQLESKRQAVLRIQNWWRACIVRREWSQKRQSVVQLQAQCRGFLTRTRIRNRHQAATVLQAYWRGRTTRLQLQCEQRAALRIQCWWRGRVTRRKWVHKVQVVTVIQAHCRGFLARRQLQRRHCAATLLQAYWRGHMTRKQLYREQDAASRIQSWWLGCLARRDRRRKLQSIVRIQAQCRGFLTRTRLRERHLAATVVQAHWRGYVARSRLQSERRASLRIQSWWRSCLVRRQYLQKCRAVVFVQAQCRGFITRARLRERHRAVTVLQAYWRGRTVRRQVHSERRAALQIQSWWRGRVVQREWSRQRQNVILIQAQCRGFLTRIRLRQRHLAATVLQAHWRGHVIRSRLQSEQRASLQIQSWWRACFVRHQYLQKRQAVVLVQAQCRGFLTRTRLRERHRAATVLQAYWRGRTVRRRVHSERRAALQIQSWWRARVTRRQWLYKLQFIVNIQAAARGYLRRNQMDALQVERTQLVAVRSIQRAVRNCLSQRRLLRESRAASVIQQWFRARQQRREYLHLKRATLCLQRRWRIRRAKRDGAARLLQRCWRTRGLQRFLHHRRNAAICIQSHFRGWRLRRRVGLMADAARGTRKQPVGESTSTAAKKVSSTRPPPTRIGSLDGTGARKLIQVHMKLQAATRLAQCKPGRSLAARARAAVNCLIYSTSVSQVLQAIKELEIFTRLSREICSWALADTSFNAPNQPSVTCKLYQLLLDLIHACNRSVPHEDILLGVTGILLNIARHPALASLISVWWLSPSQTNRSSDAHSQQPVGRRVTPMIVSKARSRLQRSHSLTALDTSTELVEQVGADGDQGESGATSREVGISRLRQARDQNENREGVLLLARATNETDVTDCQTSVVETLVGILMRCWRARPGTLGLRLFTRTCCLLATLCGAIPATDLPASSLLPVFRQLSDCLARRSKSTQSGHIGSMAPLPRTVGLGAAAVRLEHSEALLQQSKERLRHTLVGLRKQLSYDLNWHLYPCKARPEPLAAIDLLLLTVVLQADAAPVAR